MDTTLFKQRLETERERLEKDLEAIAKKDIFTGDWEAIPIAEELNTSDENSEADGVETWNERHATVAQLETSYKHVTRALEKIANGSYGFCELNGEAIELDRLEANPSARTCKQHRDQERELPL